VTVRTRDDGYHHGDLPNALRAAGAALLAERGVAGFSLREVARRAGVSHAAPTHHFGDAQGLLTSIAVEAFRHLTESLVTAAGPTDDPRARLALIGRAYVELGVAHPGHCAIMFRGDLVDVTDPEYQAWSGRSYGLLEEVLADLAERHNPELDVELATRLCWSTMQGLVTLHPSMVGMAEGHGLGSVGPIGELAERFSALMIDGLAPGAEPN
jgi:AcrR family transcriptional regulator